MLVTKYPKSQRKSGAHVVHNIRFETQVQCIMFMLEGQYITFVQEVPYIMFMKEVQNITMQEVHNAKYTVNYVHV